MVQIDNLVSKPVLSARSVYNLMEEVKSSKNLKSKTQKKKRKTSAEFSNGEQLNKKKKLDISHLANQESPGKKKKGGLKINTRIVVEEKKIKISPLKKDKLSKMKKNSNPIENGQSGKKEMPKKSAIQASFKKVKFVKNSEQINGNTNANKGKKVKAKAHIKSGPHGATQSSNTNVVLQEAKIKNSSVDDRKINELSFGKDKKLKKTNIRKRQKNIFGKKKKLKITKSETDFMSKLVNNHEILGAKTFENLIFPETLEDFFNNYWEKTHLLVKGKTEDKFNGILSTKDIDYMLRKNNLTYTKNIDVTSYKDGKRETHNPEGRALASVVWDYFNSGCSIRLLNPQTFNAHVWKLLSTLQEYFNSFCGANVYLTPPGTQGFAPHWDDIEAFIIQLEGKKRWRVYKWRSPKDTLPRESSGNFSLGDSLGELVLDCVLEPGDLLYFPRGFIHQAEALEDTHSLHMTISTFQKNSWVDLLEKLLPAALQTAAEQHSEFREGLPLDYLNGTGIAYSDIKSVLKAKISQKVNKLVRKMMAEAPIDAAIDQMAKGFIHDSLPPFLRADEKRRTIFEGGEKWSSETNTIINRTELTPETTIRLLRRGCVRLLVEEDSVRLFHSVENSREYHEEDPKFIEIAPEIAPGVEKLIHSYPNYITIEDLPLDTLEDKMVLTNGLWEKGIIIVEEQLQTFDEEEEILGVNMNPDE